MEKTVGIGNQDFEFMRKNHCFYADVVGDGGLGDFYYSSEKIWKNFDFDRRNNPIMTE